MKHVAIIGGGAAAAALVGELLRQQRGTGVAISWFAGTCARGRGIAYSTSADHHVLNVRAAGMGLFADDAGAFFRYVGARAPSVKASDFVPRSWFGDFVEATLASVIDAARARGQRIDIRQSIALAVRGDDTLGYTIGSDDGASLRVDAVVLATGALPSTALPEVTAAALDSGNYVVDMWLSPLRSPAPRQIVVIGTGLTAIDAILQASLQWPEAHITAVSRHGRLPAAHLREPGQPYEHQTELIEEMLARPNLRRWSHVLREAAADNVDWRAVIDGLRPVTPMLWQALSLAERKRFLRHLRAFWEPMRHRLPPQTAAAIETLRADGRLDILAAHVERIDGDAPLGVHLHARGSGNLVTIAADLVIQATGPRLDASATRDPLFAQLLADGLAKPDTVGLGIAADASGQVLGANGNHARRLRVIGALLRGSVWECAAFAEIRVLARNIAEDLLGEPGSSQRKSRATPISGLSRSSFALTG